MLLHGDSDFPVAPETKGPLEYRSTASDIDVTAWLAPELHRGKAFLVAAEKTMDRRSRGPRNDGDDCYREFATVRSGVWTAFGRQDGRPTLVPLLGHLVRS